MNSYGLDANPTVADEVSALMDDAEVISKTLPSAPNSMEAGRMKDQFDHAVLATRDFVIEQPVLALLMAAAAGAALTALLSILVRGERL
jgi:hypothetical protein